MTRKAVVIGLDGAAWHLLDPMIEADVMPRLGALKARGSSGTLASTIPTYTPPAWTSSVTGVNPGRHGVYGFIEGNAQAERQELMHSGKIKSPTLWEIANAQGVTCGIYNLPLTYPPRPLDGWMVSGMMTPGYGESQRDFVYPATHQERILSWAPGYVLDVHANYEQDWRDDALAHRALASIKQRYTVLDRLLQEDPVELLFTVQEAPDRIQHVYYRYMDPRDPLYDTEQGRKMRDAVLECFAEIDRIIGLLEDWASTDGGIQVVSDHGFTAWEVSVHQNALLEQWGYLKLKPAARAMQTGLARSLVPLAKRVLPRKVAREAKNRTFAAIDWANTRAFASPIPQQGIFVNLAGRERFGVVPPDQLEALKDDLVRRFEELRAPDGSPATDRVYRSEEVFSGHATGDAPDILPVLRDHRFELDDELFHKQAFTDVSDMPRGVHHPDGIIVVAGPGAAGTRFDAHVTDVMPTLLYQAGCKVPEGLDGKVMERAFEPEHLAKHPVQTTAPLSSSEKDEESPYSAAEEAEIEEALRGLGYL
jgi:predicted AlkP superfamily phosphohydrolase/phosphomutase